MKFRTVLISALLLSAAVSCTGETRFFTARKDYESDKEMLQDISDLFSNTVSKISIKGLIADCKPNFDKAGEQAALELYAASIKGEKETEEKALSRAEARYGKDSTLLAPFLEQVGFSDRLKGAAALYENAQDYDAETTLMFSLLLVVLLVVMCRQIYKAFIKSPFKS